MMFILEKKLVSEGHEKQKIVIVIHLHSTKRNYNN